MYVLYIHTCTVLYVEIVMYILYCTCMYSNALCTYISAQAVHAQALCRCNLAGVRVWFWKWPTLKLDVLIFGAVFCNQKPRLDKSTFDKVLVVCCEIRPCSREPFRYQDAPCHCRGAFRIVKFLIGVGSEPNLPNFWIGDNFLLVSLGHGVLDETTNVVVHWGDAIGATRWCVQRNQKALCV